MKTRRFLLASLGPVALAAALAGCAFTGGPSSGSSSADVSDAAYNLSVHLADTIGRCWFAPGDTTFAGYVYSPERNAGVSRVLLVNKGDPTGLPALVIEATSGSTASIYGPLTNSPAASRIQADVARWAKGSSSCT